MNRRIGILNSVWSHTFALEFHRVRKFDKVNGHDHAIRSAGLEADLAREAAEQHLQDDDLARLLDGPTLSTQHGGMGPHITSDPYNPPTTITIE